MNSVPVKGYNAIVDLLSAFPNIEQDLMELYVAYVFKEASFRDFGRETRNLCIDYIRECMGDIKRGLMSERKKLLAAYFDVARYQTDRIDAAIEWDVDVDVLGFLLKKRPPPENPEERRKLIVPDEVKIKRERI